MHFPHFTCRVLIVVLSLCCVLSGMTVPIDVLVLTCTSVTRRRHHFDHFWFVSSYVFNDLFHSNRTHCRHSYRWPSSGGVFPLCFLLLLRPLFLAVCTPSLNVSSVVRIVGPLRTKKELKGEKTENVSYFLLERRHHLLNWLESAGSDAAA